MPTQVQILAEQIDIKAKANANLLDLKKTADPHLTNLTKEETKQFQDNADELVKLHDQLVAAQAVEAAENAATKALERVNAPAYKAPLPGSGGAQGGGDNRYDNFDYERAWKAYVGGNQPIGPSFGEQFTKSETFKNYNKSQPLASPTTVMEVKTVFDTATGYAPQAIRIGRLEQYPTRPPAIIDIIPQGNTDQNAIVYMEETTFTNAAVEKAEGTAYPEATEAFTERTSPVRKIPVFIPVTDETMQDVPFMESFLNQRLQFMIKQRLDSQLVSGNGTPPTLKGGLNVSGINTQALGSDPAPDALYKGFNKIRSIGFAEPTNLIIHPDDWQDIRLLRTAQGVYLFGSPYDPGFDRVFGVPVLSTTAIPAGTPFAGDFQMYSMWFWKKDLSVSMGYINDDFKLGQVSIRAELRGALVYFRPLAFTAYSGF